MDRKKSVTSSLSFNLFSIQGVLSSVLVGLLGLGLLTGCTSQGGSRRWANQNIRPAADTSRLVQNAEYLKRTGRLELALEELEEARLREPNNLELLGLLIQAYEDLGDFDRAEELYQQALSRGLHHPALENNRCFSLYLRGRLEDAEACFRKILDRQADNHKARNNLGLTLCRQGRETEALAMWREALSDVEARGRLGQALAALGKEVPPSLDVALPRPAPPQPAPLQAAAPPAAPKPIVTLGSPPDTRKPEEIQKPVAAAPQPLEKASTTPNNSTHLVSQTKQPGPKKSTAPSGTTPSPIRSASLLKDLHTGKAQAQISVSDSRPSVDQEDQRDISPVNLTALDLHTTHIEIRNGNGIPNHARETGSLLSLEGFNVVGIGNHIDFGLEETVIAFRPEAARVVQVLAQKFFPGAKLEQGGKVSPMAAVRVSLGRDKLIEQYLSRKKNKSPVAVSFYPATHQAPKGTTPKVSQTSTPTPAKSAPSASPAVQDLNQAGIELRNGNGVQGQAREMRTRLTLEGFTVVSIGNHIDFGLDKTIIAYRPEAAQVAESLSKKFFPGAILEVNEDKRFSAQAAVRVSLGRDLIPDLERLAQAAP
jgi:Tfp pilus assembly protein PilF